MPAKAQAPPVFLLFHPQFGDWGLGSLPSCLQAGWSSACSGENFPHNPAFLREENPSRNPPADVLSHGSELGHVLMLKPATWQEWNLHDNWRVRPLPTFPKAHGPAEKSGF